MLGFKLNRKPNAEREGQRVTARLKSRLMPIDRGEVYEDPLNAVMKAGDIGEVMGGGTELDENGEAAFCDVELKLFDRTPENLDRVVKAFEKLGAPKGSKLLLEGSVHEVEFGVNEGFALYLDGFGLADDVYETCDLDTIVEELNRALEGKGRYHGFWQGDRETAVYFYGPSFDAMKSAASPFVSRYPLCQNARIERIA
ncbi:MAG: hypothetical protein WD076_04120 [Parvularculaceae bacterium]